MCGKTSSNDTTQDTIYDFVDRQWLEHQRSIYWQEVKRHLGDSYPMDKISEEEFKLWWEKNKDVPYNEYFYELILFVWDEYATFLAD